jgi:hypothetical protein
MTFTTNTSPQLLTAFQDLEVDQQLALFYFIYKEMGSSITPAAPGASTVSPEIAEGLFNQIKNLSFDEQLQLQRNWISGAGGQLATEYGALSDTTKLLVWYRLAQGMDSGEIIPLPDDYQLSGQAKQVFEQVKGLEFQQQITFFRDLVSPMGTDSTAN